jgi:protein TonB
MNTTVAEKRPLGALGRMGLVAGLHVAALYLIATGLGIVPSIVQEPIIGTVIDEAPPPDALPPAPPQPRIVDPELTIDPPVPIDIDTAPQPDALFGEISTDPPRPPDIISGPQHSLVAVRHDSRYPLTQPTYPARDIREGNEGTVELEIYVLPTGRIGDARVVRSAGSPSLDQSAIDEAKRKWRMLPATRDGEPYAQWHRLKVTFNLRNR